MPRFNVPKSDASVLEAAKIRYQFITQHDEKTGTRVLCRFTDVHKRPFLETSSADEESAFKMALTEFHKRGAAPSPEAIAEENARLKAELAALKSGSTASAPAETTSRGRGRPPGAKNKPKTNTETPDDEGAGDNSQDEPISSNT